jgi:hypothetical protein
MIEAETGGTYHRSTTEPLIPSVQNNRSTTEPLIPSVKKNRV